jgi:glycosyltransferase involved in cell wall biosynthesis
MANSKHASRQAPSGAGRDSRATAGGSGDTDSANALSDLLTHTFVDTDELSVDSASSASTPSEYEAPVVQAPTVGRSVVPRDHGRVPERIVPAAPPTIVCLSHLRWDFVYQRPQHLLTRAARQHRVVYVEEPKLDAEATFMEVRTDRSGVTIAVPHIAAAAPAHALRELFDELLRTQRLGQLLLWYYTPMALQWSDHVRPIAIVYDCMDELSAFAGAPPELPALERELLLRADLVLTGGHSLYCSKRRLHPNVHEFPSGVDVAHFAAAKRVTSEPADQVAIPKPRIGFFGVLDERLDRGLLAAIAALAPGWHFVLIGPVTKISAGDLPRAPNLHYLGPKSYEELPQYLAGWDVAMMPFAMNAATRYISPTKTPEYLAAGKPVVSTPIADVVRTYGAVGLAHIAETPDAFVQAIRDALCEPAARREALADAHLASQAWDRVWARVSERIRAAMIDRRLRSGHASHARVWRSAS